MAILTSKPNSTDWQIVLNRVEMQETEQRTPTTPNLEPIEITRRESDIVEADIRISGHQGISDPSSYSGSRGSTIRSITLPSAILLLPTQVTITNRQYPPLPELASYEDVPVKSLSDISVIQTINVAYRTFIEPYLDQIRNKLEIGLTKDDIPDSTVEEFLRTAELQVYQKLNLDDTSYDTKAATDMAFQEKARIAVTYRTAALLLISYQEIVREVVLRQQVQYKEVDLNTKYNYLIEFSDGILGEEVVNPGDGSTQILSEIVQRRLDF